MAVIYEIRPGKTVRRARPTKWTTELADAFERAYGPAFDGEPADPTQLELFKVHNSMVRNARWFTYPKG